MGGSRGRGVAGTIQRPILRHSGCRLTLTVSQPVGERIFVWYRAPLRAECQPVLDGLFALTEVDACRAEVALGSRGTARPLASVGSCSCELDELFAALRWAVRLRLYSRCLRFTSSLLALRRSVCLRLILSALALQYSRRF
jgi:hypothetical protein